MDLSRSGLKHYVPLPGAVPFHESPARTKLVYGSNLAGKTLACAVEFARLVLAESGHHREFAMVGYDYDHVNRVMWQALTSDRAFRFPGGSHAQPLIPNDAIDYRARDPEWGIEYAQLNNSYNRISLLSSADRPPAGIQWDAVWVDEHLQNSAWVFELLRGCVQKNGLFLWSLMPDGASREDAWLMAQRSGDDYTEAFRMTIEENIHIHPGSQQRLRRMLSPLEVNSRWHGSF